MRLHVLHTSGTLHHPRAHDHAAAYLNIGAQCLGYRRTCAKVTEARKQPFLCLPLHHQIQLRCERSSMTR